VERERSSYKAWLNVITNDHHPLGVRNADFDLVRLGTPRRSKFTVEGLGRGVDRDRQDRPLTLIVQVHRLAAIPFATAADVEDKVFRLGFPSSYNFLICPRWARNKRRHQNDYAGST
jgi:hypothetical protein